jgi:hypothetical protein
MLGRGLEETARITRKIKQTYLGKQGKARAESATVNITFFNCIPRRRKRKIISKIKRKKRHTHREMMKKFRLNMC